MFDNKQDSTLLRDSLISAANYYKDLQESGKDGEEEALQTVLSTVTSLSNNLYGVNTLEEFLHRQYELNQRCHAVVFINLLKSQGISSDGADNFYGSVLFSSHCLDFKFYLKLNFHCNWSEPFIKCVQQLQPDALAIVLEKLLSVECENEIHYYACHLALQTYIRKAFTAVPKSDEPTEEKLECRFNFNFSVSKPLLESSTFASESLKSIFKPIFRHLTKDSDCKSNKHFRKVIFHSFRTIFQGINCVVSDEEARDCVENLDHLTPIFEQCLSELSNGSYILQNLQNPLPCMVGNGYRDMSWEINDVYLLFLLQNFWRDFHENPLKITSSISLKTPNNFRDTLRSYFTEKNLSYKSLISLNEEALNGSQEAMKNYHTFLSVVVKQHYPFASRAAEYLLKRPKLWNEYKIIELIEENVSILDPCEFHFALAEAIVDTSSGPIHDRLLSVFFKILSLAPPEMYNSALQNILKRWGCCEYFVTPDFEVQFDSLERKSTSFKEMENMILPLFVQRPKEVLQFVIEEGMIQDTQGMEILQVLKIIPAACLYKSGDNQQVAPLISILSWYFEHPLVPNDAKKFVNLLKTLMEIQASEDILTFDSFLSQCILPNFCTNSFEELEFKLDCLHAASETLFNKHALEISNASGGYFALFEFLGKVMNSCIDHDCGALKETVMAVLKIFAKLKKKPELDIFFRAMCGDHVVGHEVLLFGDNYDVVKLYIIGILSKEMNPADLKKYDDWHRLMDWTNKVIQEECEYLWVWCFVTCNNGIFADKISLFELSYLNMLHVLTKLLRHLTRTEWLQASKLIMYYQHLLKTSASDYPELLPDSDPEVYGVIQCLMACYTIMMAGRSTRTAIYCASCLTDTILSLLDKKTVPPHLLITVFLGICHLTNCINIKVFRTFAIVLFSLRKQYLSICDKSEELIGTNLMQLGLENIKVVDKESLEEMFRKM